MYPTFSCPLDSMISDQYAYRTTDSTTAAIFSIFHHAFSLLSAYSYASLIFLDFSKAFDYVRNSTFIAKLAALDLPEVIYNW